MSGLRVFDKEWRKGLVPKGNSVYAEVDFVHYHG